MKKPRIIYQAFLDEVSSLLWNGSYDGVAGKLSYPHTIHMPETDCTIPGPEQQKRDTQAFRESLNALGATAFHRMCRQARFDPETDDRIVGVHTTYVMRGGSYLTDPYDCAMSLIRGEDGLWLSDAIRVTIRNSGMTYYSLENVRARVLLD